MKFALVTFVAVFVGVALASKEDWINFKNEYGKSYHGLKEEQLRYNIFEENLKKIEEHNKKYVSGESSFELGINKFADMKIEEFRSMLGLKEKSNAVKTFKVNDFKSVSNDDIPAALDWRTKGAVTEVKDQGNCGSCWAFSVTGAVEGENFLASGKLISLSEQELVDCDDTCSGCGGCWLDVALKWIQQNGLETEKDYPYEAIDDKCRYVNSSVAVRTSGYEAVKPYDEDALKKAIATKGPTSIAIDADENFMMYKGGIFNDASCSPDFLNHGVLAVGYDTDDAGEDYWIVKNSWGTSWGEQGYIRMIRNKNMCGISDEPFYAVM